MQVWPTDLDIKKNKERGIATAAFSAVGPISFSCLLERKQDKKAYAAAMTLLWLRLPPISRGYPIGFTAESDHTYHQKNGGS